MNLGAFGKEIGKPGRYIVIRLHGEQASDANNDQPAIRNLSNEKQQYTELREQRKNVIRPKEHAVGYSEHKQHRQSAQVDSHEWGAPSLKPIHLQRESHAKQKGKQPVKLSGNDRIEKPDGNAVRSTFNVIPDDHPLKIDQKHAHQGKSPNDVN